MMKNMKKGNHTNTKTRKHAIRFLSVPVLLLVQLMKIRLIIEMSSQPNTTLEI